MVQNPNPPDPTATRLHMLACTEGFKRRYGVSLFAFGSAYWPLALANSDLLSKRVLVVSKQKRGGGAVCCAMLCPNSLQQHPAPRLSLPQTRIP